MATILYICPPQDFLIFSASNPSRAPLPPPPSKSQQEITLKQPEASCLPTVQRRLLKCFLNARVFHNPFNYKGRLICPLPVLQRLEGEISCFVVDITKAPAFEFTTQQQMDHRTSKPQPRSQEVDNCIIVDLQTSRSCPVGCLKSCTWSR